MYRELHRSCPETIGELQNLSMQHENQVAFPALPSYNLPEKH